MFKTAITRQAAHRVQVRKSKLQLSQANAAQVANSVSLHPTKLISLPTALIFSYAIGALAGRKKTDSAASTIKLDKVHDTVEISTTKGKTGYLLSFIGTVISAASLYLRARRVKLDELETVEHQSHT